MSSGPSPRVVYLGEPPEQAYAVLHATGRPAAVAVVLCPPFGWEEVTSYRPRRAWAEQLAGRGVPCLRLTLPGTGDSAAGPRDPHRVDAWSTAIDGAARFLRAETGARRVIALGLGLGGLLAAHAAATGRSVDGLIAWATPHRGGDFVRQLRTFGRMERSSLWGAGGPRSALREGELEGGGYVLGAETIADLQALDVAGLDLAGALSEGALLLERDGIAVDEPLSDALRAAGIPVALAPGPGWAEMTSHPQTAELPAEVMATVDAWLADRAGAAAPAPDPPVPAPVSAAGTLTLEVDGAETPITLEVDGVRLRAIHAVPETPTTRLAVVFLNAGAQRRIGPNRMWVEAARRWVARGVPSVRLDVEGIGDSDGGLTPYRENRTLNSQVQVTQVAGALGELQARGVADRFVLVGLCGGAYWSFHCLLQVPAVCAAIPVNPYALVWKDDLAPSRDLRRVFTDRSWALIRKNATPERRRALARWLLGTPGRWARRLLPGGTPPTVEATEDELVARVIASGKRLTFLFSEREPLLAEFRRRGRLPEFARTATVAVHPLGVNDHTVRPSWAQQEVHGRLDAALERELVDVPQATALTAPGPTAGG